ncbi:MAG: FAD binding domain-containing protein [Actinomycetota bacterium]
MEVFLPETLEEALEAKRDMPEARAICGGTDLMVELNFDKGRPAGLIDVSRLAELQEWRREDGSLFLGSGVTYARIERELSHVTSLVQASRSVGSPQIRNRGTVGGNLGTASPAGDALPPLAVHDAGVVLGRAGGGTRTVPFAEFMTGPKHHVGEPDELILGARWSAMRGVGTFSKIGTRNAMVISVAALAMVLDEDRREVRVALGSVGAVILRAPEAEEHAAGALADGGNWDDPAAPLAGGIDEEFGRLVAAAARPIDDVRGSAAYRRHAVEVLAGRSLRWCVEDRRSRAVAEGS